ncbi:MAG: MCP four helix bundle domain-containing protein, partial [Thermoguttaceae bacterium]|nr:MCP four helix bundle domain-containing protein [Thermoguttaceae bacterium]
MFARLKTGTKVLIGFGVAIAVTAVVGFVGWRGLASAHGSLGEVGAVRLPGVLGLEKMLVGQFEAVYGFRSLLIERYSDLSTRERQYTRIQDGLKRAAEGRALYEALPQTPEETVMWKEFLPAWEAWNASMDRAITSSHEKDRLLAAGLKPDDPKIKAVDDAIFAEADKIRAAMNQSNAKLEELVNLNVKLAEDEVARATVGAQRATLTIIAMVLGGVVVATALGVWIARNIAKVLRTLIGEAARLTEAAVQGRLETRGNPELVSHEFRPIIEGLNATLDAVVGPLNVAAEYVDRIAKGDIPPKITDQYHGDFNEIKNNLNQCIDALNAMLKSLVDMGDGQKAGDIEARCRTDGLAGIYLDLMKCVNEGLDACVMPVCEAIGLLQEYAEGDLTREMRQLPGKQIIL